MSTESGKAAAPFYAPVQTLPPERLAAMRATALATLCAALNDDASSWYRARPGHPFARFADVPLTSAAELAAEVTQHPPFGRLQRRAEQPIRAGLATATLPHPLPMCWTQADLEAEAGLGARAFWRAGLRPRGRSSDTLDGGLVTPGTLAVSDALDRLDALALPVGPIATAAALARVREVWDIVRPQVLITTADTAAFLDANGGSDAVRVVLLTPEQRDLLGASARPGVYRILSLPIVATFLAGECDAHDGFHVAEDAIAVEIIDPVSAQAARDGDSGSLVVTALERCYAVVRFDTGLHASLDRAPCPCGETHARLRFA